MPSFHLGMMEQSRSQIPRQEKGWSAAVALLLCFDVEVLHQAMNVACVYSCMFLVWCDCRLGSKQLELPHACCLGIAQIFHPPSHTWRFELLALFGYVLQSTCACFDTGRTVIFVASTLCRCCFGYALIPFGDDGAKQIPDSSPRKRLVRCSSFAVVL